MPEGPDMPQIDHSVKSRALVPRQLGKTIEREKKILGPKYGALFVESNRLN